MDYVVDSDQRRFAVYSPRLRRIPLAYSPAGLWHFDGTITDSSGNARNLTASGTPIYTWCEPGFKGVLAGASGGGFWSTNAAFYLAGDMTAVLLVKCLAVNVSTQQPLISCTRTSSTTEAYNILYKMTHGHEYGREFISEHGAAISETISSGYADDEWTLATIRRADDVCSVWDGPTKLVESAMTTPTGGTSSRLALFGEYNGSGLNTITGHYLCAGAAFYPSALSDAQIIALARETLGYQ